MIYSHQEMHIKSTNISISSADNKGQLRTSSLTNNNSSKSNTEALCCVEISQLTSAFLWRYEPVRRTGKSDDWLTIFFARIIRFTVQKFQLFWVIFCIIIFFIELWHILILWLAKMPNGGMPVFTLIATGWRYRKIFFYKKSNAVNIMWDHVSSDR